MTDRIEINLTPEMLKDLREQLKWWSHSDTPQLVVVFKNAPILVLKKKLED